MRYLLILFMALIGCQPKFSLDDKAGLERFARQLSSVGLTAEMREELESADLKSLEQFAHLIIEKNLELKDRPQHISLIRIISNKLRDSNEVLVLELISNQESYIQDLYNEYIGAFDHWLSNSEESTVKAFILDKSRTWSGPAANMSEQLRVYWLNYLIVSNSLEETMDKIDEVKKEPESLMLCRSLYSVVYSSPDITTYADWLKAKLANPIYRDLAATTATGLFRQEGLGHAINWCQELPDGSSRHNAFLKTFEMCAMEKPQEGISWFSSHNYPLELSTQYPQLSGKNLSDDITSCFIDGLLQNRETDIHPTEWIKKVSGSFRKVLISEGAAQLRRYDPQIAINPGYQLQVDQN